MNDHHAPRFIALAIAGVIGLSGCTRSFEPEPAEPTTGYEREPAPELLGEAPPTGPRPQDETGLLGGPPAPGAEGGAPAQATMTFRRPEGVVVSTMQTVPDATAEAEPPAPKAHKPRRVRHRAARPVSTAPVTPVTPVSAEPALASETPATPNGEIATAPDAPFTRTLPVAPPDDPKLAALQGAIGDETATAARLSVEDTIAEGKPGAVRFSLPATLAARLKAEAAKLGLAVSARTAEVTARLSGEGYKIDPPGAQTVPVTDGEPIVFNWRVTPGEGAGPLKAEADLALTGEGKAQSLALAAVESTPPPAEAAAAPAKNGPTTAKWALAAILILLAALVLGGVWRNYKDRRRAEAERRERERAARMFTPVSETRKTEAEAEAEAQAKADKPT